MEAAPGSWCPRVRSPKYWLSQSSAQVLGGDSSLLSSCSRVPEHFRDSLPRFGSGPQRHGRYQGIDQSLVAHLRFGLSLDGIQSSLNRAAKPSAFTAGWPAADSEMPMKKEPSKGPVAPPSIPIHIQPTLLKGLQGLRLGTLQSAGSIAPWLGAWWFVISVTGSGVQFREQFMLAFHPFDSTFHHPNEFPSADVH